MRTQDVGLSINQEKTKYLEIKTKRGNVDGNTNAKMGQYYFERVEIFNFLGSIKMTKM